MTLESCASLMCGLPVTEDVGISGHVVDVVDFARLK